MTEYLATAIRKRAPKGSIKGIHPCPTCGVLYENVTGKKRYCSPECFPRSEKACLNCGTLFTARKKSEKTCSIECREKIAFNKLDFERSKNPNRLKCCICQTSHLQLASHLFNKHQMSTVEYLEKYPDAKTVSEATSKIFSENVKGEKNAWFNHGGVLSPFSKKNKKLSEDQRLANQLKVKESTRKNGNNTTSLIYYLKKTDGDIEAAKELLKKRQTTFSLEKCIEKYGSEEGLKRWQDRQEKWHKNYKKSNYSQVSQRLFEKLVEYADDCQYAERGGEFVFKTLSGSVYKLDFWVPSKLKVIEFDGDYWHGRGDHQENKTREAKRDNEIINTSPLISILHVREKHFYTNQEEVIKLCKDFLQK